MNGFRFISQKVVKTIKRNAKKATKELSITHTSSLDLISQRNGFHHWHHLLKCAEKSEEISANSIIIRFTEHLTDSTKSLLDKHGFYRAKKNLLLNEFMLDHHDKDSFWITSRESYLEIENEIYICNRNNQFKSEEDFIGFAAENFYSTPDDILYFGKYINYDEATDDGEILLDFDYYSGMWD